MLDELAEARAKFDRVRERLERASDGQEGMEALRAALSKLDRLSDEVAKVEELILRQVVTTRDSHDPVRPATHAIPLQARGTPPLK
jgi:hypothetical protein